MNIVETVKQYCTQLVEKLGFELYEVTFTKDRGGMNLTLYIDNPNGAPITLEDCEKVSLAVEPAIEEHGPQGEVHYNLSVSSLGLDWPIKNDRDFKRNQGKKVQIKLYSKQDGKKDFVGLLLRWDEQSITVSIDWNEKTFQLKDIANIQPYIEF